MPPPVEGVSLAGQVILITGANTGLGFEAAKHFVIRGPAKVIIVCRDEGKGQMALNKIKSETNFSDIELWTVDLGSFTSILATKEKVDRLERLDILVGNAALATLHYGVTEDGWEDTLQVNFLGAALLTILLLPKMLETARSYPELTPRIVSVSSGVYRSEKVPIEAIDVASTLKFINGEGYSRNQIATQRRYAESKILLLLFIQSLQSRLLKSDSPAITCCSVSPGFCYSQLRRELQVAELYSSLEKKYAFTSEEGSRQLLFAAIGGRERETEFRGAYITFSKFETLGEFVLSPDGKRLERKVWSEVLDIVGRADERLKETVEKYLS
ncbi:NAD(P)-binding protein [Marasmius fiardii PR-910]|nr:NAD(P)-binding protein [Marasmius fiardii PR-910]